MVQCKQCNGKGEVPIISIPLNIEVWRLDKVWAACPTCHGPGFIPVKTS